MLGKVLSSSGIAAHHQMDLVAVAVIGAILVTLAILVKWGSGTRRLYRHGSHDFGAPNPSGIRPFGRAGQLLRQLGNCCGLTKLIDWVPWLRFLQWMSYVIPRYYRDEIWGDVEKDIEEMQHKGFSSRSIFFAIMGQFGSYFGRWLRKDIKRNIGGPPKPQVVNDRHDEGSEDE